MRRASACDFTVHSLILHNAYLEIVLYKHLLGGYLISLKIPVVGENAPNIVKLALTTNHAILPLSKDPLIYFRFEIHFLVNPANLHYVPIFFEYDLTYNLPNYKNT